MILLRTSFVIRFPRASIKREKCDKFLKAKELNKNQETKYVEDKIIIKRPQIDQVKKNKLLFIRKQMMVMTIIRKLLMIKYQLIIRVMITIITKALTNQIVMKKKK